VAVAKRVGITSPLSANASLALGTSEVTPLELTAAYAAFANGGDKVAPYFITEVDDAGGKVLYRRQPPTPQRVIAPATDRDLVAMLWNVVVAGTGTGASLSPREAAGKTGTTQDSKDAWFVGFTTDYVAAVWVGNDDNTPTRGITGGTLPAQIWRETMRVAEEGKPLKGLDRAPPQPPNDQDLVSSGVTAGADDESGAPVPQTAEAGPPMEVPPPPERRRRSGGILGWLFGSDEDDTPPPPPPPR
jgi:penicillin-binding protein 1A